MSTPEELKEWADNAKMISVDGDPCFVYVNWEEVEDDDNPLILSLTPAKNGYEDIDFYEDAKIEIEGSFAVVDGITLTRLIEG